MDTRNLFQEKIILLQQEWLEERWDDYDTHLIFIHVFLNQAMNSAYVTHNIPKEVTVANRRIGLELFLELLQVLERGAKRMSQASSEIN